MADSEKQEKFKPFRNKLPAAPPPVTRPAAAIKADPSVVVFTAVHSEPPKTIVSAKPSAQPASKSKKWAKWETASTKITEPKQYTKILTRRNPIFPPNLPSVEMSNTTIQKNGETRTPDQIPLNVCQANNTSTSNGMCTIINPLMSITHQQNVMHMRPQAPSYPWPQHSNRNVNYWNHNFIESSYKSHEFQNRITNFPSFAQINNERYALFKPTEDNQQRNLFTPGYFVKNSSPRPVLRPSNDKTNDSLFANPIQGPENTGTTLMREGKEYSRLYTLFGPDGNIFRNAMFSDKKNESNLNKMENMIMNRIPYADPYLPYFESVRLDSKLNNEVLCKESKFYQTQVTEPVFSGAWPDALNEPHRPQPPLPVRAPRTNYTVSSQPTPSVTNLSTLKTSEREMNPFQRHDIYMGPPQHMPTDDVTEPVFSGAWPDALNEPHRPQPPLLVPAPRTNYTVSSQPTPSVTNLSTLKTSEREMNPFQRHDIYMGPPQHMPTDDVSEPMFGGAWPDALNDPPPATDPSARVSPHNKLHY